MENREFSSLIHLLRWWCSVGMLVHQRVCLAMSDGEISGDWTNLQGNSQCVGANTQNTDEKKLAMLSNWHRTWNPATDNRIPWFDKNYPEISGQRRQMPIKSSRGLPFISTISPMKIHSLPRSTQSSEQWTLGPELFGPFFFPLTQSSE